jgi:hypothetical protein
MPIVSQVTSDRDYICPEYRRLPGDKKCQHYAGNGACSLEGAMLCVEWVRANPEKHDPGTLERMLHLIQTSGSRTAAAPAPAGRPEPTPPPPDPRMLAARPGVPVAAGDWVPTPTEIDALAARGYELELETEAGTVVLVPKYTSQERVELTYADARTLASIASVFPGTKLRRVSR